MTEPIRTDDQPRMPGRSYPWAALIVLLMVEAVLLFLAFVPTPHNGGDNAGYVALAHSLLERGEYVELWDPAEPPHTKYPPGFPLLLAGLIALGARTWTALKVIPFVSALLAVAVTFNLARDRRGWVFGLVVAGVFGISDALVYHASWVLSDLPFFVFTLGGLWALDRADKEGGGAGWVALGAAAAILAFFTRSAGLPMIVAAAGWMALRGRWKALAVFGGTFAVLAFGWWARARGLTGTDYVGEFWLVNPYEPALGTVGFAGLLGRVTQNFLYYVLGVFPQGLGGIRGPLAPPLGLVLTGLAVAGWALRIQASGFRRLGVVELFVPFYLGLILLWPEVWSGDRFALPLLPLLLVYGFEAMQDGSAALARAGRERRDASTGEDSDLDPGPGSGRDPVRESPAAPPRLAWLGVGLVSAALLIPNTILWWDTVDWVRSCRQAAAVGGAFACNGSQWTEFAAAAHWSGAVLPEGSAVLSRKPRIFYVLSGMPGTTYPFFVGAELLQESRRDGRIRYVVLDRVDRTADAYLVPSLAEMTAGLCGMEQWVADAMMSGTQLLGFKDGGLAGGDAAAAPDTADGTAMLDACPDDFLAPAPREWPAYGSSSTIPLLSAVP
jgi:hypothetical protein